MEKEVGLAAVEVYKDCVSCFSERTFGKFDQNGLKKLFYEKG